MRFTHKLRKIKKIPKRKKKDKTYIKTDSTTKKKRTRGDIRFYHQYR